MSVTALPAMYLALLTTSSVLPLTLLTGTWGIVNGVFNFNSSFFASSNLSTVLELIFLIGSWVQYCIRDLYSLFSLQYLRAFYLL